MATPLNIQMPTINPQVITGTGAPDLWDSFMQAFLKGTDIGVAREQMQIQRQQEERLAGELEMRRVAALAQLMAQRQLGAALRNDLTRQAIPNIPLHPGAGVTQIPVPLNNSASRILTTIKDVPDEIVPLVLKQLQDLPTTDKSKRGPTLDAPMTAAYLSLGYGDPAEIAKLPREVHQQAIKIAQEYRMSQGAGSSGPKAVKKTPEQKAAEDAAFDGDVQDTINWAIQNYGGVDGAIAEVQKRIRIRQKKGLDVTAGRRALTKLRQLQLKDEL